MTRKIRLFVNLFSFFTLFACSNLTEGEVVEKYIIPSYVEFLPTVTGGKTTYQIPMFHDESYMVKIQGNNEKGEVEYEEIEITESEYKHLKIGDYYSPSQK